MKTGISKSPILVSRKVNSLVGKKNYQTVCGTPEYLAPEILKKAPYGKSVDFWNFGCLVYELLIGQSPFHTKHEDDFGKLYKKISYGIYEIPGNIPESAADLIRRLLEVDPAKRLGSKGIDEIKNHQFFAGVNWNEVLKNNKKGPLNIRYEKEEIKLRALNVNLDDMIADDKTIELDNFSFNETQK